MEPFLAPTLSVAGNMNGREDAIMAGRCIGHPIGCGVQLTMQEFLTWPALNQREFQISGWCKDCQDKVFVDPDSELECCCVTPCSEVDVGVGVLTCATAHCVCDGDGDASCKKALEFLDRIYEHDMEGYYGAGV
jgi:hypothetical protein